MAKFLIKKSSLFFVALLSLVLVLPSISFAALSVSKTWNDQFDWEPWTKANIQSDSSGGLRLASDLSGGFATDGQATFQFLPGGIENSWVGVSHVEQDKITGSNTNQLTISFSVDGASWYSEADLNAKELPDSASLYIRAVFHNDDGTNTPVLTSLSLNYETKEEPRLLILKRAFLRGTDENPIKAETATYEPGDTVVVRVKIDPMELSDLNLVVRDYRPTAFNVKPITTAAGCGLNPTDNLLSSTFSANEDKSYSQWNDVRPSGISYLCYQYEIDNTKQPKNHLVQARVLVYDQDNFDTNQAYNQVLSNFSAYLMVRGFAFTNSDSYAADHSTGLDTSAVFPIDDILSFARTVAMYTASSGETSNLSYSAGYVYKRGLGQRSRGGELYSLPVQMKSDSGEVIAADQSYVLYNPAFYLFGNIFSANSISSNLDFSSRSEAISNQSYSSDFTSKLNSEASLYNYYFDQNSVFYWQNDPSSSDYQYKNKELTQSINKLTATSNRPAVVCDLSNQGALSSGNQVYLNNKDCNINAASDNSWPNGRVWYLKPTGDITIGATLHGQGTIIIDYQNLSSGTVGVSTKIDDFPDGTKLGLIVINGGKVLFTKDCQKFNGVIFAPGR